MAKERKSSVSRALPDIAETSKAVAQLTKDVQETENKLKEAVKEYDPDRYPNLDEKKKIGRPKSEHGKKRFTTLLEPDYIDLIKSISNVTGIEQNELLSEAVKEFLEKFKNSDPSAFNLAQNVINQKKRR